MLTEEDDLVIGAIQNGGLSAPPGTVLRLMAAGLVANGHLTSEGIRRGMALDAVLLAIVMHADNSGATFSTPFEIADRLFAFDYLADDGAGNLRLTEKAFARVASLISPISAAPAPAPAPPPPPEITVNIPPTVINLEIINPAQAPPKVVNKISVEPTPIENIVNIPEPAPTKKTVVVTERDDQGNMKRAEVRES